MRLLKQINRLFFPINCAICHHSLKHGEEDWCIICETELAILPYQFYDKNPVEQLFLHRFSYTGATAFLNFLEGGRTQQLIHAIKYKGETKLAEKIGKLAAEHYRDKNPQYVPDIIVPVPLHFAKKLKRGYNQSEKIANGMAQIWNSKVEIVAVIRKLNTITQTKKSKLERIKNMADVFEVVDKSNFYNKHILVVDDVITTGATIESLCLKILEHKPLSLHIIGIAFKP